MTRDESSLPSSQLAYNRLQSHEIRLVKFTEERKCPDSITLELVKFSVQEAPPYLALSYVWGDAQDTRPVQIGSQPYQVTQNLYSALLHVAKLAQYFEEGIGQNCGINNAELFLWIDAICINQQDLREKADQIPRMAEIYGTAYNVLIWLGTVEEIGLNLSVSGIMLHMLDKLGSVDGFPRQERIKDPAYWATQKSFGALVTNFLKLFESNWFTRVWVLQEYTMSRRHPCAMIGEEVFSLPSLYRWPRNFSKLVDNRDTEVRTKVRLGIPLIFDLARKAFGFRYSREWFTSPEFRGKSLACQLMCILMNFGSKTSTLAHDQIHGLLGMTKHEDLPSTLQADYAQPCEQLYADFTRFLIEQSKDLRILAFKSNNIPLKGQPSWVVDFRSIESNPLEPLAYGAPSFSHDGRLLTVEGVFCGSVISFFTQQDLDLAQKLQNFHDTILTKASKIRKVDVDQVWQEWLRSFLVMSGNPALEFVDQYPGVTDMLLVNGKDVRFRARDEEMVRFTMLLFEDANYALMNNGQVVVCLLRKDLNPDKICEVFILKGAIHRYLFSKTETNNYFYLGWLPEKEFTFGDERITSGTPNSTLTDAFFSSSRSEYITIC